MTLSFDVHDRNSWYFGAMTRQEATDLLMGEREGGVFLVRDSNTIIGDYVLCVREDAKVSHYIINRIVQGDKVMYRIGDQSFGDLPELLDFYKLHYLDTTPLRRPATRRLECVLGKFDFDGSDQEDLPFKKGEILYIINKDEDQWWTAKNTHGQIGQIPVPYVQKVDESQQSSLERQTFSNSQSMSVENQMKKSNLHRPLPAHARVKQPRVPNAYDKTALKLEMGDVIKVTKMNINGQWEGELRGKVGHFPFTHVEFIDTEPEDRPEE
ncbi:adapter molecule Crk [Lutzomyia longipalpis]|uniref:Putative family adapter n=1 Tax=Lutzomyia longipalpis TaxID=7200 RepID=A0A1B0CLT4_LUTLO|nr:adapter molecule Crk [Lutzomyia longipalpis]